MRNKCACLLWALCALTARAYSQAPGPCPGLNLTDCEVKLGKLIHDQAIAISVLRTKLGDDEKALAEASAANQNADAKLDQQAKLITNLQDELAKQQTGLSNQVNTYTNQISALRAELNAKVADAEAKAEAKAEASHQELIQSLKEDVAVVNAHTQQIGDLRNKLTADQTVLSAQQSRLTTFDVRLQANEAALNASTIQHFYYTSVDSSKLEDGYLGTAMSDRGATQPKKEVGMIRLEEAGKITLEGTSDSLGGVLSVYSAHNYVAARLGVESDGKGRLDLYGKTGMDVAEQFESAGTALRPGTVAAIVPGGKLLPSSKAYDRTVVGVVSGAGSLSPAISLGTESDANTRSPIAVAGQVYVRVCLQSGPVRPGDLLVASSRDGVAMRASESEPMVGAVIGKALEKFDSASRGADNEGLVRMIVMLR